MFGEEADLVDVEGLGPIPSETGTCTSSSRHSILRASGNQDSAFENLAADRLAVNRTDLHCLNAIENAAGLTAGELAAEVGLTSGAVTVAV